MNATLSCFSSYQVQGAYAHLNQRHEKDLDEAVSAATTLVYYNDPLRLAVPYVYLLEMLPESPDGLIKSILSLTLILIVYLYPILRLVPSQDRLFALILWYVAKSIFR